MELKSLKWSVLLSVAIVGSACGSEHTKSSGDQTGPNSQSDKAAPTTQPKGNDAAAPREVTAPTGDVAGSCPAATADRCSAVWKKIDDLQTQRDKAVAAADQHAAAQAVVEINYQTQVLELLRTGKDDAKAMAALDSKYSQLRTILAQQGSVAYDPREVKAVAAVFKDYGDLYLDTAMKPALADGSAAADEASVDRPWAAYWYPFTGDDLSKDDPAKGQMSPLSKLDRLLASRGLSHGVAAAEERFFNPSADSWEGRCAPWAIASITSPEPTGTVVVGGTAFTVSDQKALAILTHEQYPSKVYGIRYNGDADTDGTFQSMRPEAFHQLFLQLLSVQHKPFILNDDSGTEVWSRPVYRARWSVKKDPAMANAFLVSTSVFTIFNREAITDDLTSDLTDRHELQYQYRLYVDPAQMRGGKAKVIAGEWLDSSFTKHPHYVTVPVAGGALKSNNNELNQALGVVKEILATKPTATPAPVPNPVPVPIPLPSPMPENR